MNVKLVMIRLNRTNSTTTPEAIGYGINSLNTTVDKPTTADVSVASLTVNKIGSISTSSCALPSPEIATTKS